MLPIEQGLGLAEIHRKGDQGCGHADADAEDRRKAADPEPLQGGDKAVQRGRPSQGTRDEPLPRPPLGRIYPVLGKRRVYICGVNASIRGRILFSMVEKNQPLQGVRAPQRPSITVKAP